MSDDTPPPTEAQLEFLTALATGEYRVLYREDREALRAVLAELARLRQENETLRQERNRARVEARRGV